MIEKSFYFLRQGKTNWNLQNCYQGQQDIPLNQTGVMQAQHAAKLLQQVNISNVYSSPLERALKTANIITLSQQVNLHISHDLKERSWGENEGCIKDEHFWQLYLQKHSTGIPQQAETQTDFRNRINQAITQACKATSPPLIVAHGGILLQLFDMLSINSQNTPHCTPLYFYSKQGQYRVKTIQ